MRTTLLGGFSAATTIVCVLLGGCASVSEAPVNPPSDASAQGATVDLHRYALSQAYEQVSDGELAEALPVLTTIIHSPAFDQLESELQHSALLLAGFVALDLDKAAEAHPLLVRASAMPEAGEEDWLARLQAASWVESWDDAIESVTQLARRWPEQLSKLNHASVQQIVGRGRRVVSESKLYAALDALYVANWKLAYDLEPSHFWRDLAALELERQQLERAREILDRIHDPHTIVSMRIDRRFDRLREAAPQHFDIDAAVANDLARMREIVQRSPRSLEATVQLTYSLLNAGLYEDVLRMTGEVMDRINDAPAGQPPYDDMDKQIWILDNRARALAAVERWAEAEAEVRAAANRKEGGEQNVSNVINLAMFYAAAGRNDEALSVLLDVGQMSPYGHMQMHSARYTAAMQKGDMEIANESFAYLEQHRDDALETWQWTLVRANRLDEAAALLIERLGNPVLRGDALEDVQDYATPPPPSQRAVWLERWSRIKQRPDVRRAIDAVGRIEKFRIPRGVS